MEFKSVLIEREDKNTGSLVATSGVLVENQYVLTTSNILGQPFLDQNEQLINKLEPGKLHICTKTALIIRAIWQNESADNFISKKANLLGLLKCKNLDTFCQNDFKEWTTDFSKNKTNLKNHISIFLLFKVENDKINNLNFRSVFYTWLRNILNVDISKADRVACVSCPFGCRDFLGSFSEGIISTILKNGAFYLCDCASAPGCEGGLIYLKDKCADFPVGLVVSAFNWWRKDWVGFTFIADLRPILSQLLATHNIKMDYAISLKKQDFVDICEQCVAQINCGVNWGTAILISKSKGLFLTNSHVIREDFEIRLFWNGMTLRGNLIYATPNDCVFDLAVVRCAYCPPSMISPRLDVHICTKGDPVYCVGYPLFSTVSKPEGISITKGVVSASQQYMLKTTCAVYPGFSGGPVLSPEGHLLGIIVCNTTLPENGAIFPKYNMAIPFKAVVDIINAYVKTEDDHLLKQLRSADPEAVRIWNNLQGKL